MCISISICVCLAQDHTIDVLQQTTSLLKEGQRDKALSLLDQLNKSGRLRPTERFQLGWLYGQAKEFHIALEIFSSLPETVPDPVTHNYAIALSYFNLGRFQDAIGILVRLKDRGLADERTINLLGVAYAKAGEADKAYHSLREGVLESPANQTGYLNLVTLCVDYENLELAEKIATRGLEAFPKAHQLFVSRGAVRLLRGTREIAREDLRKAVSISPRDREALFLLALCEYEMGLLEDAIATLTIPIKGGFADPDLHYLMAEAILRLDPNNIDAALRELDRAISLDPKLVAALVLKGKIHLQRKDANSAATYLEQARLIEPESRSVLYNLGKTYQALGRNREAQDLFRQVKADSYETVTVLTQKRARRVLVERQSHE